VSSDEDAGETTPQTPETPARVSRVSLVTIIREWGRIGCTGFGGPPTHIRLLRDLCVRRRGWLDAREFEDAIAVCNLMPGPASTQLAIWCAWRLRGRLGALAGGAAFIVPGLIVILALAALFLGQSPPLWVLGAGAGAGAAVPAVAVHAGSGLVGASWRRRQATARWLIYLIAGAAAAAVIGVWLVLVLLGCGLIELAARLAADGRDDTRLPAMVTAPMLAAGTVGGGVLLSVAWVAFKVGALSYGGGFVIVPLMQSDAVSHYHWMTGGQFLNAVALGQITPGPVVQTVAVIGYAAAGVAGGLLASVVAFAPSFAFVLLGARHFDRVRGDRRAQGFLGGAGPAAIGAIFGSAIPLARALTHPWQYAILGGALALLLLLRRGVVLTLICAGTAGAVVVLTVSTALR
ncbi:MAG TPA: chromate efflux transporter, partial [Streptosporangiaceae bacterium]|nr:chromate efflux transporter [Streptosporangiaceae bacterium]